MLATLKVYYLLLRAKLGEQHGQDIMEYAILTGFVAIAAAVAFFALPLGDYLTQFATAIGNCVNLVGAGDYVCP